MEIKETKIKRAIDLANLPQKIYRGRRCINWEESIGMVVEFVYDGINGELEIIDYIKKKQLLVIRYNHKETSIRTKDFTNCRLGRILDKRTKEFKLSIGETIIDNKRHLVILDKKKVPNPYNKGTFFKYYKCHCINCGWDDYWIEESNLLKGVGCACCRGLIVVEKINDIATTDSWMIPYIGLEVAKTHTHGSNDRVYPVCPYCGRKKNSTLKISSIYTKHSIGCTCGDGYSQISKFMFSMLEQLKEQGQINDFKTEKIYDWCKYYNPFKEKESSGRYDFVIEDLKLIIETDGGFHRKDNSLSGQTKEESQWIDSIKDKLAFQNGYTVIRISDEGEIKQNILNSELKQIFDFENISWNKCLEYSCTNLVKIACDYKNTNPNLTTTQIGNIMGCNRNTISRWLKNGNELGWCHYDPKEEQIKILQKNNIIK